MAAPNGKFMVLGPYMNMTLDPPQPYANINVYHYAAGTDTLENVYTDPELTNPAPQPLPGDARGVASFYANATLRLVVKTSVADGEQTLYDWSGVECWNPDATLRSENRGSSYPAATSANRGQIFGKTNGAGVITEVGINKDGASFAAVSFQNDPLTATFSLAKGADIASAATLTLGSDGNYFVVTGNVGITAISSKAAGTVIRLRFSGTPLLTHNGTSLILMNDQNFQIAAGDVLTLISEGSGNWREVGRRMRLITNMELTTPTLTNPVINGTGLTGTAFADQTAMEAAASASLFVTPGRQHFHPRSLKAWARVTFSGGTPTLQANAGVSGITDGGAGLTTVTWTTAFSSTDYACVPGYIHTSGNTASVCITSQLAASCVVHTNASGTPTDLNFSVMAAGDI